MSNTKLVVTLVLALALGFGGGYLAQIVGGDSGVSDLSDRVDRISENVSGLQSRMSEIPDDFASYATVDEVRALRSSLGELEKEVEESGTESPGVDLSSLQSRVEDVENQISSLKTSESTGGESGLRIGYVNAKDAFSVFTDAVQEERQRAQKKNEELVNLREQAIQGEITEEEYQQQADILQAEKLKAQLEIDLAMVDKMIAAKGFESVADRLRKLKGQVDPVVSQLDQVLTQMRNNSITPQEAEGALSQINNQYQQLDDLLTNLIETKIFQITNRKADEEGYDLVFRQSNVILYRDSARIDDLTDTTKETLKSEMTS